MGSLVYGAQASENTDKPTNAIKTIDYEHHTIHEDKHFFIVGYQFSVGQGDTIDFVVTTPDTLEWAHMIFRYVASAGATLQVYEDSSGVVGGSATTPINNNRNSNNTSSLSVVKDPTSVTAGTLIYSCTVGATSSQGFIGRSEEIILKQNTVYLFRLTSEYGTNVISFNGQWYEHTNTN